MRDSIVAAFNISRARIDSLKNDRDNLRIQVFSLSAQLSTTAVEKTNALFSLSEALANDAAQEAAIAQAQTEANTSRENSDALAIQLQQLQADYAALQLQEATEDAEITNSLNQLIESIPVVAE